MRTRIWTILAAAVALVGLVGCVPIVIGAGAIAADTVMEAEGGGDGLF